MKIVFIGGQNVPGIGGAEAYMYNMALALLAQKHDVTIICSNRKAYTTVVDGVEIVHKVCPKSNIVALPILFFKSLSYICKHRRVIDIVNFQSIFFAFIPGWIATMCGCKVCYTIHSLAEDNPKHGRLMRMLMKIVAFVSIWCCGRNIITVSNSKAKEIKSRYGKKSSVIPCGVNLPILTEKSDILERFNLVIGRYYLTIGRIDPIKNLDVLIKGFCENRNNNYKLVIAGDYSNEYGQLLQELATGNKNIVFVGSVFGLDKECLLENCFVNCLVSSSEGMPISLLEAMVYGKICIVTDIPSIREIMQPEWGRWCEVRDVSSLVEQMKYVENNYGEAQMNAEIMSDYIKEHHTWDKIAKNYSHYLFSIIGR